MLAPGSPLPRARVWGGPRDEPVDLGEAIGPGPALLCFYLWDWSPT